NGKPGAGPADGRNHGSDRAAAAHRRNPRTSDRSTGGQLISAKHLTRRPTFYKTAHLAPGSAAARLYVRMQGGAGRWPGAGQRCPLVVTERKCPARTKLVLN